MRALTLCFSGLVLCALFVSARAQHPVPPGLREIEKHPPQMEPPAPPQRPRVDPAQLKREAAELAKLAEAIPAQIDAVTRGKLPKRLQQDLKQIEKLAKRLRVEVAP